MFRQSLIYIALSILVVIFAEYVQVLLVYIDMLYTYVNIQLAPVFNTGPVGIMIRKMVSLVIIPLLLASIPALTYRLIKGKNMPYFIALTWLLWLIIVLSKILIK